MVLTITHSQAEENKDEHLDEMLKKIKEHEAYVSKVDSIRTNWYLKRVILFKC